MPVLLLNRVYKPHQMVAEGEAVHKVIMDGERERLQRLELEGPSLWHEQDIASMQRAFPRRVVTVVARIAWREHADADATMQHGRPTTHRLR